MSIRSELIVILSGRGRLWRAQLGAIPQPGATFAALLYAPFLAQNSNQKFKFNFSHEMAENTTLLEITEISESTTDFIIDVSGQRRKDVIDVT